MFLRSRGKEKAKRMLFKDIMGIHKKKKKEKRIFLSKKKKSELINFYVAVLSARYSVTKKTNE